MEHRLAGLSLALPHSGGEYDAPDSRLLKMPQDARPGALQERPALSKQRMLAFVHQLNSSTAVPAELRDQRLGTNSSRSASAPTTRMSFSKPVMYLTDV
jgi:hypothetical protein